MTKTRQVRAALAARMQRHLDAEDQAAAMSKTTTAQTHTPGPESECYAQGTSPMRTVDNRPIFVHNIHGSAWEAIPTAVDRSRLIAAAPDLLKALNQAAAALATFSTHTTGTMRDFALDEFKKAKTTIAKAEGRE